MAKKRRRRRNPARCPCGSGESYSRCCGRFHHSDEVPGSPEELMRSRYSAYAKGEVDYIVETTDPEGEAWSEPVSEWRQEISSFSRNHDFPGVEVRASETEGDRAWVRFHAKLKADGRDGSFTERSEFVRRDGRWFYACGDVED